MPEYFLATSKAKIENTKAHGGQSGYHTKLIQAHLANILEENRIVLKEATYSMELAAMASTCKEYNACILVYISNDGRYRSLKTTLDNEHLLEKYFYPKTLEMSLKLIMNFQTPGNGPRRTFHDKENTGMAFVQRVKAPGAKGEIKTNRQENTNVSTVKNDHWQNDRPDLTEDRKT